MKSIDGVLYRNTCDICGEPIIADVTRYMETDDGLVCEECWHDWCTDTFNSNSRIDHLAFDENIEMVDRSGRF